jgi:tungstate transport system permease protein
MAIGAPLGDALAVAGSAAGKPSSCWLMRCPARRGGRLAIYLLLSRSGPLGFAGLLFTPAAGFVLVQRRSKAAARRLRRR